MLPYHAVFVLPLAYTYHRLNPNCFRKNAMNISRRFHMQHLIGIISLPLYGSLQAFADNDTSAAPINPDLDQGFIKQAFDMRKLAIDQGDQAYGAIVVTQGEVVGQAPSRVVTNGDPTAHAEMEAIRDAAHRLGSRNLNGCWMYSSSRPCPMCEAAAYWAGIDQMIYGTDMVNRGVPKLRRC